jgi:hypothetical protein
MYTFRYTDRETFNNTRQSATTIIDSNPTNFFFAGIANFQSPSQSTSKLCIQLPAADSWSSMVSVKKVLRIYCKICTSSKIQFGTRLLASVLLQQWLA